MLNRATLLVEDVIDTTPLPSGLSQFQLPWMEETYNVGFLASSESGKIMEAVPWHSGSVWECLQLDVLLSRR